MRGPAAAFAALLLGAAGAAAANGQPRRAPATPGVGEAPPTAAPPAARTVPPLDRVGYELADQVYRVLRDAPDVLPLRTDDRWIFPVSFVAVERRDEGGGERLALSEDPCLRSVADAAYRALLDPSRDTVLTRTLTPGALPEPVYVRGAGKESADVFAYVLAHRSAPVVGLERPPSAVQVRLSRGPGGEVRGVLAAVPAARGPDGTWVATPGHPAYDVASLATGSATLPELCDAAPASADDAELVLRFGLERQHAGEWRSVEPERDRLHTGDQLRVRVESSAPGFVYLVNYGTQGDVNLLFPYPAAAENQLSPGRPVLLGPFEVDAAPGVESFDLVVSTSRVRELSALLRPGATLGGPQAAALPVVPTRSVLPTGASPASVRLGSFQTPQAASIPALEAGAVVRQRFDVAHD